MSDTDWTSCVGAGWRGIVTAMLSELPPGTVVTQCSEKFGRLRIYFEPRDPRTDMVASATVAKWERFSATVCEDCGAMGDLRHGGWLRTLCDSCEVETRAARRASDG